MPWLERTFLGNTLQDYAVALAVFAGGVLVLRLLQSAVLRRLRKITERTETVVDDFLLRAVEKFLMPLLYFGAFYTAARPLLKHSSLQKGLQVAGVVVLTFFGIRLLLTVVRFLLSEVWLQRESDDQKKRQVRLLMPVLNVVLWGMGLVFLLDNLGFEISTIIAGLGIGGIAVALAAQTVLRDLFSYFSIVFDKPFEIGDFIILDGDFLGTIEYIGIKSTRLRSLGGEQLILSNSDLIASRIRNYKRMAERRVVFRVGVTYGTSVEKLEEAGRILRKAVEDAGQARLDRVHFARFGDSSLEFEVVYYVLSADYNLYMDIQERINLKLVREFHKAGLEFAFPTQTIHLVKETEGR